MQDFIKARIKSLPPLSDTTIKVQQICADPEGSLADLSKVVQADPMLTANILRSANSPLYGFSREITTVERAVNLFGMVTVKGFALSAAMKQSFKIDLAPYGLDEAQFLELCTRQNVLAASWLTRANDNYKRVCIPASFLLEIGKLILASALVEQNKASEFKEQIKELSCVNDLCELERKIIGFSSYEITAMVFDKWALDIDMVDAIANLKEPKDNAYSRILRAIIEMTNCLYKVPIEPALKMAQACSADLNLDQDGLDKAIGRLL